MNSLWCCIRFTNDLTFVHLLLCFIAFAKGGLEVVKLFGYFLEERHDDRNQNRSGINVLMKSKRRGKVEVFRAYDIWIVYISASSVNDIHLLGHVSHVLLEGRQLL